MKAQFTLVLVLFCLFTAPFHAQEVEFNYEGRVSVDGLPYTGQGYFKFAIVNWDGSITYWSNDDTSTSGSEPATEVVTDVTDGVFNVIIGDASNMNPLEASIFNGYEQVFLRVWFSDGVLGFEHLTPDRRITNPALLGSQSFREIDLYVDPATGDDQYPGTNPAQPKRTIQAAWDTLPPMIRRDATIHLADGIYREEVLLRGKSVIGDATISILGNESSPSAVRVTGAEESAPTTAARDYGFHADKQRHLVVQGIQFEYCISGGFYLTAASYAEVSDCKFFYNGVGLRVQDSSAIAANLEVGNSIAPTEYGIYCPYSDLKCYNCYVHDIGKYAFIVTAHGKLAVYDCVATNSDTGYFTGNLSILSFYPGDTGSNQANNCTRAAWGRINSTICFSGLYLSYSGPGQGVVTDYGTVLYP